MSRNSPHLSNHLQNNNSAPSSPSMSNGQQQAQSHQQPVGYPSPTGYPSPSVPANQAYYQTPEPQYHRASPASSTQSLPPMRLDRDSQQLQHNNMGSNLPPPVAQMGGQPAYYHDRNQTLPHPSQYPSVTSDPTGGMRYALPATDNRVMSGGRHKKEIKRRTKTGCLTCRKRRIKCDEAHPACRNCQKSKRDCLGYDPIFKQQPGPAAIQPAPSSAPSVGGIAATSNPYGHQPQMMPSYATSNMNNYDPALSAGVSSPGSANQQFDYASAIDPALEAVGPTTSAAPPSTTPAATAPAYASSSYPVSAPAKRTVEHLLDLGGVRPPRDDQASANPTLLEEIKHLYYSIYAPGLEGFLESKWYSVKGLNLLLANTDLLNSFGNLLQQFGKTAQNDQNEVLYTSSVEARVVWALATLVHGAAALELKNTRDYKAVPSGDDPVEAHHRLNVFETLVTGRVAATNPLTQPIPGSTDHHRLRELEFWHSLGKFVTLDYEDDSAAKAVDDCLATLRNLLDGRENRDVLYSIAVARGLGHRVSEYTELTQPLHLDESDIKSKLLVAKKFVSDEAGGAGTTNVIRRLCDLAARSWSTSSTNPSN